MNGEERRSAMIALLQKNKTPVKGDALAQMYGVSRQVIVSDIALIKAKDIPIVSTNRGYIIEGSGELERVFKVQHKDSDVEQELCTIIDNGGWVKDIFVYHKVHGVIKAEMDIHSRRDIKEYLEELKNGNSLSLKNVTNGYHYHTVRARDKETLDLIQEELQNLGFLARLMDYEPVDFWKKEDES